MAIIDVDGSTPTKLHVVAHTKNGPPSKAWDIIGK
jgi:hypothetical protein